MWTRSQSFGRSRRSGRRRGSLRRPSRDAGQRCRGFSLRSGRDRGGSGGVTGRHAQTLLEAGLRVHDDELVGPQRDGRHRAGQQRVLRAEATRGGLVERAHDEQPDVVRGADGEALDGIVRLRAKDCVGCLACVGFCPTLVMYTVPEDVVPFKCIACGNCATYCVLEHSAVKCVQAYAICGYCDLCTGYLVPEPKALDTGAENELCPTGAIKRTYVEDPYYEYTIDEKLCIGCAKCVEGCTRFGNGSFYLQIRHDRCVNCNECSIARTCPGDAFLRVPADQPYLLRTSRVH